MKSCALLPLIALIWFAPAGARSDTDADPEQRLAAGGIVLLDADSSEAGGKARVQALFQASAESVWAVITSCELSFVFVNGMKECEVIEERNDRALIHQVVKTSWLVPRQDFVFESLREPYREIRFGLVEGNLRDMQGSWRFTGTPDGLLVDYSIRVRPALPVPGFLVSWVMRRGMPDLIACIRGLAGGSGSPDGRQADLERCRGDTPPGQPAKTD